MCINVQKDSCFLYELKDFWDVDVSMFSKFQFYLYKQKLYGRIIKKLSFVELGCLLEYGTLIYGQDADVVLRFGQKVKTQDFSLFSL